RYYTGDVINPQVMVRYPGGDVVEDAKVTVQSEWPANGTGNVLTGAALGEASVVGGDQLDRRSSTLNQREQAQGGTLIPTATNVYPLFDDGDRDGDYALEPNGIFGDQLVDKL